MTEAEWRACEDVPRMLDYLRGRAGGPGRRWYSRLLPGRAAGPPPPGASDRKLRLFACACCRLAWDRLHPPEQQTVGRVEEWVEGRADPEGELRRLAGVSEFAERLVLRPAAEAAQEMAQRMRRRRLENLRHEVVGEAYRRQAPHRAPGAPFRPDLWQAKWGALYARLGALVAAAGAREATRQPAALRDVVGNPFRPAPALDPGWLAWNGGTVRKMAQLIYDDRPFDRLPILADALEDAGCSAPELLGHLRGPGPHARGCWAVDLLLGKE
jgi:hypothetical protein